MSGYGNILAIDTTLNACGAGVYAPEGERRGSRSQIMSVGHAERLIPMIGEVMKEAGLGYPHLGAIVTTIGPGAFTGLRIGMAAARGLALALDIPLYGVTTTQALALQYGAHNKSGVKDIAVVLETKREDFYFQIFTASGKPVSRPDAVSADVLEELFDRGPYVIIGDGTERVKAEAFSLKAEFRADFTAIDCASMAEAFYKTPGAGFFVHNPSPLYLREADVTLPKNPPRRAA